MCPIVSDRCTASICIVICRLLPPPHVTGKSIWQAMAGARRCAPHRHRPLLPIIKLRRGVIDSANVAGRDVGTRPPPVPFYGFNHNEPHAPCASLTPAPPMSILKLCERRAIRILLLFVHSPNSNNALGFESWCGWRAAAAYDAHTRPRSRTSMPAAVCLHLTPVDGI